MGDLTELDRVRATVKEIRIAKLDRADQLCDEHPDDPELRRSRDELANPALDETVTAALRSILGRTTLRALTLADVGDVVVLEGAQGILLDRDHGFFPHVTPSSTTFVHAERFLCELAWTSDVVRVGVLRAYATRHGAGPLVTEDAALTEALPERHNGTDRWQGRFRLGWFDAPAARYALRAIGGVDALVLTNLDRLRELPSLQVCERYEPDVRDFPAAPSGGLTTWWGGCRPRYEQLAGAPETFAPWVESVLGRRVDAVSTGPTASEKLATRGSPI
jgi:adenylosuccinate synthase